MFISQPHNGTVYIAKLSRRGSHKLLWSVMPVEPVSAAVRIEAPRGAAVHLLQSLSAVRARFGRT
jgi:hypothetical protein